MKPREFLRPPIGVLQLAHVTLSQECECWTVDIMRSRNHDSDFVRYTEVAVRHRVRHGRGVRTASGRTCEWNRVESLGPVPVEEVVW